jgi:hypothetical protein
MPGKVQNRAKRKHFSVRGPEGHKSLRSGWGQRSGCTIKLEPSINPLFDGLPILTIFPFSVRTFPSPSLTRLNRPSAVDRPSRDDRCSTFMPKAFIQLRKALGLVHSLKICPVNSTSHRLNFNWRVILRLTSRGLAPRCIEPSTNHFI